MTKVSESITRLQKVHSTVLSVPTLLKTIQQLNSSNGLANSRESIFTVDDLKRKLGFTGYGVSAPSVPILPIQHIKTTVLPNRRSRQLRHVEQPVESHSPDDFAMVSATQ